MFTSTKMRVTLGQFKLGYPTRSPTRTKNINDDDDAIDDDDDDDANKVGNAMWMPDKRTKKQ